MDLTGKVAIVTGATSGIGRAIASTLGREGARVAICSRTPDRVAAMVGELEREDLAVLGRACDVSDESSVTEFTDFVRERWGPADVLVNNAGLAHSHTVAKTSAAEFDETMAVNVRGVFLMTRAVLAEMRERRTGHIVNIASLAGKNAVPGAAAYAASKHAVLGFSKSLMLEVRKYDIRVVAICPGSVVTDFFEKSGIALEHPERKLQPQDVADLVLAALRLPERAAASELDLRPTNP